MSESCVEALQTLADRVNMPVEIVAELALQAALDGCNK
jgi:4-alpha-glucanotransferase